MIRTISLFIFCIILLAGCGRKTITSPNEAMRLTTNPDIRDDLPLSGLLDGIELQVQHLKLRNGEKVMKFGPYSIQRSDYLAALEKLLQYGRGGRSVQEFHQYIQDNFKFLKVYGSKQWGDVFITSYFEPVIPGSMTPQGRFTRPLYRAPKDMLSLDLGEFGENLKSERARRARIDGRSVRPYYSREEIDSHGVLRGQGLEICYVDPVDAFFLQVQGSGTVQLIDGRELRIVYADKNGHAYKAIGAFLKEKIAPEDVTLQSIERYLWTLSAAERDQILNMNPSYVFFSVSEKNAVTALGVSATAGRTIATDRTFFPKGALGFLEFDKPVEDGSLESVGRFVLDQDVGGAITGPGRLDLFWGRGDEAKRYAGITKGRGTLYYLFPK